MKKIDYIDHSSSYRRAWSRAQEIHRKKLIDIENSSSRKSITPSPQLISRSNTRKRTQTNERIVKENSQIFKKILQASPHVNTNLRSGSCTPKMNLSLYSNFETRQKERIKQENRRLALMIVGASPSLTVKKLKQEYREKEKIKKNICKPHSTTSKFSFLPIIRGQSLQKKRNTNIY